MALLYAKIYVGKTCRGFLAKNIDDMRAHASQYLDNDSTDILCAELASQISKGIQFPNIEMFFNENDKPIALSNFIKEYPIIGGSELKPYKVRCLYAVYDKGHNLCSSRFGVSEVEAIDMCKRWNAITNSDDYICGKLHTP